MSSLTALLLATPLFGLSLTPPDVTPYIDLQVSADLDHDGFEDDAEQEQDEEQEEDDYVSQMRTRNSLADIHRPLGIATWVAMTTAVTFGWIQYYNKYGFFADQGSNPCVTGDAIFGQGQCTGRPWFHTLATGTTTALYAATFTISLMMPDPDDLSDGKGEFAGRLRLHKTLRWVHFAGMIAQVALGLVLANDLLGLDRANDYETLQALATVHMGIGMVTWGALSWAGALMVF